MSFANPLFLFALFAVAIPVAVHLFNFRHYRKIYFSNVSELNELQQESRRTSRLRSWLILAARILAVVFIVLAFARPFMHNRQQTMRPGTTAVSIYIDNSFSMLQTGSDGVLLECAKRKAAEIVKSYAPSDLFQLLTNDLSGGQFQWLSRDDFLSVLDEVEASPASVPLSDISRQQCRFLRASNAANCHQYCLSDFQQSTADVGTVEWNEFSFLVPFEAAAQNNLYIDTLVFNTPSFYRGAMVQMEARLNNVGEVALEQVPVRLFVNGRQRDLASVDIPAQGSASVPLSFHVDADGNVEGWVETSDYPISFDDTLFFSLNVAPRIAVLDISDNTPNPYLCRLFANDSAVAFRVVSTNAAASLLSEGADSLPFSLVVVDELKSIPTYLSQCLVDFASDGGTLLVVPSADADVDTYNFLLSSLHGPRLGPLRHSVLHVTGLDFDNLLYRNVFNGVSDNVELPSFVTSYQVLPQGAYGQSVLSFASGEAALMAFFPVVQQPSYLLAAPLHPDYTDFVNQSLFVPTLYNMALYGRLCPSAYGVLSSTVPPIQVPQVSPGTVLSNADSSFQCVPHIQRVANRWLFAPYGQVPYAGNFHLGQFGLSLNYPRLESQMSFISAKELSGLGDSVAVFSPDKAVNLDTVHSRSLTPYCLLLALLMLLAEIILLRFSPKEETIRNISS